MVRADTSSYDAVIAAPFGLLGVRMRGEALACIDLGVRVPRPSAPRSPAAGRVAASLEDYFRRPGAIEGLDLALEGTPFQRRVWRALTRIRSGSTLTYGALAATLGTSARAVGGACRENPVPIVVPCHRVVAAGGAGGFMGRTRGRALSIKSWLLHHEARDPGRERD